MPQSPCWMSDLGLPRVRQILPRSSGEDQTIREAGTFCRGVCRCAVCSAREKQEILYKSLFWRRLSGSVASWQQNC